MSSSLDTDTETWTYTVSGMHCRSCALNVGDFVQEVEGVREVNVDLESGRMTVRGEPDDAAIRDAVAAAGYSAERLS
jgi:copper chaperone CopZ